MCKLKRYTSHIKYVNVAKRSPTCSCEKEGICTFAATVTTHGKDVHEALRESIMQYSDLGEEDVDKFSAGPQGAQTVCVDIWS